MNKMDKQTNNINKLNSFLRDNNLHRQNSNSSSFEAYVEYSKGVSGHASVYVEYNGYSAGKILISTTQEIVQENVFVEFSASYQTYSYSKGNDYFKIKGMDKNKQSYTVIIKPQTSLQ